MSSCSGSSQSFASSRYRNLPVAFYQMGASLTFRRVVRLYDPERIVEVTDQNGKSVLCIRLGCNALSTKHWINL